jgi:NAD(P)-dependent dehydrogenase (short-subunit alcohol dehydrogenase family)
MSAATPIRVALVSGGNRGIGFAICRQLAGLGYVVLLGSRDPMKGVLAADQLKPFGDVRAVPIDTAAADAGDALRRAVAAHGGRLDALINNAAILIDEPRGILDADFDELQRTVVTNVYGPLRLAQAAIPIMRAQGWGRIVNVSSEMGQLSSMGTGSPAYRLSKTALNSVTTMLAAATRGENILVNSCCPGWVHTDMGGPEASLSPEDGADTPVWLATLPDGGPTGGFFQNRRAIAW